MHDFRNLTRSPPTYDPGHQTCNNKDVVRSILPVEPGPPLPDLGQDVIHVVRCMGPENPRVRIEVVGLIWDEGRQGDLIQHIRVTSN